MTTLYDVLGSSIVWEVAADQPGDIYTDTGGTTQAANGQAVAAWRSTANGSVSSLSTQSTSGSRPTYQMDYAGSGYPALYFDGGDGLVVPHDEAFNAPVVSLLAVIVAESLAAFKVAYSRVSDENWNNGQIIVTMGMGTDRMICASRGYYGGASITMTANTERALLLTTNTDTTENVAFISTGRISSHIYGSSYSHTQPGGIGNGGAAGGSYGWLGAIRHLIFVNRELRLNEIEWCKYLLSERWGLGVVVPPAIGGGNPMLAFQHGLEIGRSGA